MKQTGGWQGGGGVMLGHHRGSLAALAFMAGLGFAAAQSGTAPDKAPEDGFPVLPLPPPIEELYGLPSTPLPKGRQIYLELLTREAERQGLPAAVADAVAQVESAYAPGAVGAVGEIGLMQVLPATAAMLGHRGGITELFQPETNLRYGIAYLAKAWQLTDGDLCRSLMKYRAGHGEERMSPLSVEYCRRARAHLAGIGSPLAEARLPTPDAPSDAGPPLPPIRASLTGPPLPPARASLADPPLPPVRASLSGQPPQLLAPSADQAAALGSGPPTSAGPKAKGARVPVASRILALKNRRVAGRTRTAVSRALWAAHEARMKAISSRISDSRLRIMSGG